MSLKEIRGTQRCGGRQKNNCGQVTKVKCASRWSLALRLLVSVPLSEWVKPAVLHLCLPPPLSPRISVGLMSHYTVRGSTHPLTRGKGDRKEQGGMMPTMQSNWIGEIRESEVADKSVGNEARPIILKSTRQRRLYGCGRNSVARWFQLPYTCGERTLALSVAWGKPAFNEDCGGNRRMLTRPVSPDLLKLLIRLEAFVYINLNQILLRFLPSDWCCFMH